MSDIMGLLRCSRHKNQGETGPPLLQGSCHGLIPLPRLKDIPRIPSPPSSGMGNADMRTYHRDPARAAMTPARTTRADPPMLSASTDSPQKTHPMTDAKTTEQYTNGPTWAAGARE